MRPERAEWLSGATAAAAAGKRAKEKRNRVLVILHGRLMERRTVAPRGAARASIQRLIVANNRCHDSAVPPAQQHAPPPPVAVPAGLAEDGGVYEEEEPPPATEAVFLRCGVAAPGTLRDYQSLRAQLAEVRGNAAANKAEMLEQHNAETQALAKTQFDEFEALRMKFAILEESQKARHDSAMSRLEKPWGEQCARLTVKMRKIAGETRILVREARAKANETNKLLLLLGHGDLRLAVLPALSVVGLWRARKVCKSFNFLCVEVLGTLPRPVAIGGTIQKPQKPLPPNTRPKQNAGFVAGPVADNVEALNLATLRWTSELSIPRLPVGRLGHCATVSLKGEVFVVGGKRGRKLKKDNATRMEETVIQW